MTMTDLTKVICFRSPFRLDVPVMRFIGYIILTVFQSMCSLFGYQTEESPRYSVVLQDGDREIRSYESYIVASTKVEGEFREAQSRSFKKLAAYIFGSNVSRQSISITSPVTQSGEKKPENISMTSPVLQSQVGSSYVMSFMMPSKYSIDSLPKPIDSDILFETVPKRQVAVIRYTWTGNAKRNSNKAIELEDWLASLSKYKIQSAAMFAGYNPPWTIPFLRRNEMHIVVVEK